MIDLPKPLPKDDLVLKDGPKESCIFGIAMYDYSPTKPQKLSLSQGDRVCIIDRSDPDWWRGYVVTKGESSDNEYLI